MNDPFRTLNIAIEAKLSVDRLFFMIDGIWEKLADGYSDGLKSDCESGLLALREYGRALRKLHRLDEKLSVLTAQEKAERAAKLAWELARFRLLLKAGATGASPTDLRRLVDAHPELYPPPTSVRKSDL